MSIPEALLQRLRQNDASLTSLSLNHWELTDNDITTLLQALAQSTSLTSLNLEFNRIGASGAQTLAQNTTLTSLNLSYNQIGDAGAQALTKNTTLTLLKLGYNEISDTGAQALAQNTTLTSLDLWNNNIGAAGAQALAQNTTLISLDLGFNEIGDTGARTLAQNITLTLLDLMHNQIGDAGAQALAQNTTLTSLNLSYNQIGAAGAQALAKNTTLTLLNLKENQIGDAGAQALAKNTTLTSLNLQNNQIGAAGAQTFMQNTTLIQLDLDLSIKMLVCDHITSNQIHVKQWLRACELGDTATLQTMLAQKHVSLYAFDPDSGATAWHAAVDYQQVFVMQFLLQQASNPQALFKRAIVLKATPELKKSPDNLFLQTVRAIESYSNAIIMNRVVATQKKSLANASVSGNTFFSQSRSASQSATSPATASAINTTPQTNSEGLIVTEAQRQYYQHTR